MVGLLETFVNHTLPENIELVYTIEYTFDRENNQYGQSSNSVVKSFNKTSDVDINLASTLAKQISCTETNLNATFPAGIIITQKTN